jgi:hypothetical protein
VTTTDLDDESMTPQPQFLRRTDNPMPGVASSTLTSMPTAQPCTTTPSTSHTNPSGLRGASGVLLQRLAAAAVRCLRAASGCLHSAATDIALRFQLDDEALYDELDHMLSWSLSSRLASTSPSTIPSLPEQLTLLIEQAQELHPRMAEGARRRDMAAQL